MNILITRHDKIGDFVLALPMIKLAKEQILDAKISVLVSKVNYDFAKNIDFIDEVLLYEESVFALSKKIKQGRFDIAISAFTDTKLALALLLAGIKKRAAPATKIAQIFANIRIKQRRSEVKMREFEYNIELLRSVFSEISPDFKRPVLEFSEPEKRAIFKNFLDENKIEKGLNIVAFHPGFGGSSDGNLSLDDYILFAKITSQKPNTKAVFSFGPDDDTAYRYISSKLDFDAVLWRSNLSLIDFCKLLSNFRLFVSTSTGPMHLAAAVNTPTFSFFGNSLFASFKRWGSINESQQNFCISKEYSRQEFETIKSAFIKALDA
ncbi:MULTISPECIES: glycosyltransferase family 9 protein [unclassified Campylobacter]|uniref:glycosyltransferase family 9 protein n=1 Tax=unclassified Campylobacter TaxID=2593542 RepID=UPI003D3295F7